MGDDEILAVIEASQARRWMAVFMLAGVAAAVIYVALATPPELGWQMFLLVTGGGALWMAEKLRRATTGRIELTSSTLRSSDGTIIVAVDQIASLDRGVFAFKPSNGFLIKAKSSAPMAWRTGLWWRIGRRIGIGGVTPGSQSKAMAEIIAALMAEKAGTERG